MYYPLTTNKHLELFEQIREAMTLMRCPPATVQGLQQQAVKLLSSAEEAGEGYVALGMLASLAGQPAALHAHYQQAIHLSPHNVNILANYAESLAHLGCFAEAANLMLQTYQLAEDKLLYIEDTVYFCGITGRFHQVEKLLSQWHKLKLLHSHKIGLLTEEMIEFMEEKVVTDEELEQLISLAMSVLHRHRIYVAAQHIQMSLFKDGNSKWFHYGILVPASIEQVVDLGIELSQHIDNGNFSKNLTNYFVPLLEAVGG